MERPKHLNRNQRGTSAASFQVQWQRYKQLFVARWWLVLAALVICLGIRWLTLQQVAPSFVSSGQMIVNVKLSIPSENTYSEELANFYGTQVALMQSDTVINRVNARLKAENLQRPLEGVKIQVVLAPKTSIFDLKAVGADPNYTQGYLEETMEQYIKLKKDLLANASAAAKFNLQEELAQLSVKLDKSKQDYLNFQASNSVVLFQDDGANSAGARLAALIKQREDYQSQLQLLNSLTVDENLTRQPGSAVQPELTAPSTPADVHDLNGATTPASFSATAMGNSGSASSDGPKMAYIQLKAQIKILISKRDALLANTPKAHVAGMNEEIATQEELLKMIEDQNQEEFNNQKRTLQVEIDQLNGQVEEAGAKALDASKKLAIFKGLTENHQQLQVMYDQLQASLQTLDLDKEVGQESVTILEAATPARPTPSKTVSSMIIAGLVGLVAGFGILLLLDQMNDRPTSFTELEALFDQPVLAQFPLEKPANKKAGVPVLQLEDDRHMLVESYQNLRSALIYKDSPTDHPRSIVITSASAQDGKSTVSANFAITLAQSGSRVLLVDADLRRGTLHEQFAVPAEPGLSEVLAQQCDWDKAVVPTSIPNLFLLPAGARPRRPGSLFAMHTKRFLNDIAGQYDYYLFDTAPVMAADDVSSLAPHADGLIMVIRSGFTSGRLAKVALDLLRLRNVNVIGLAFNGVNTRNGQFHGYKDKNYYPRPSAN